MADIQDLRAYQVDRDAESFRRLVLKYQGMVYSTCSRALGDLLEAEDAAQETFLKLAKSPESIRSNLGAWLYSCALNTARHRRDSARARQQREEAWSQMQQPEIVDDWRELVPVVDDCIAELPEDDRELLVQHYFAGRTQADLAAERGVSQQATAKQLARIVDTLRQGLRGKGVAVSTAILGAFLTESAADAAVPAALTASLCKIGLVGVSEASGATAAASGGGSILGVGAAKLAASGAVALVIALPVVYRLTAGAEPKVAAPAAQGAQVDTTVAGDRPSILRTPTLGPEPKPSSELPPLSLEQLVAVVTPAEERVTCSGTVLGPDGVPIAGALVEAFHRTPDDRRVVGPRVGEVTTGKDGTFTFTMPKDEEGDAGHVRIYASKEGCALGWAQWGLWKDHEVTIELGEPAAIGGKIVDEAGRPVPGAEVRALVVVPEVRRGMERYAQLFGIAPFNGLAARADAEGRFRLANLPTKAKAELLVSAPGRARLTTGGAVGEPGVLQYRAGQEDIRVVLPVEARISGVVANADSGDPVGGQELTVWFRGPGSPFTRRRCVSEVDGSFSIGALCAGTHEVSLAPPEAGVADWVAAPVHVETVSGETTGDVRLELAKGGLLEVQATDTVSGGPVEGVRVSLSQQRPSLSLGLRTNEHGICRARLWPTNCRLYAQAAGYRHSGPSEVDVVEGEEQTVSMALAPFPEVTGVVVDPAGNPVEGADVQIGAFRPPGVTDAAGRFDVRVSPRSGSAKRVPFRLLALHRQRSLATVVELADGPQTLDVRLLPVSSIVGRVVDSAGRPIAGAQIRVSWDVGGYARWGEPLTTGPDGRYELNTLPPGQSFHLSASAEGFGSNRAEVSLAVEGGERTEVEELVLESANLSVSGKVVDAEGNPVAGIRVRVSGKGQRQHARGVKTDADGAFRIDGLCAGKVRVRVHSGGGTFGAAEAEAGAQDVTVVVR